MREDVVSLQCTGMRIQKLLQSDVRNSKETASNVCNKLLFTVLEFYVEDKRTSHTLFVILTESKYDLAASFPMAAFVRL